jgi:hypothetical protein
MPTISLTVDGRPAKAGSDIAVNSLNQVKKAANDAEEKVGLVSKSFDKFRDSADSIKGTLENIAVALAFKKFVDIGTGALQAADNLNALSLAAGVSAEKLQVLRFVFQEQNIAAAETDQALTTFNRNLGLAVDEAGPAAEIFKKLGLSVKTAGGDIKSTEDIFYEAIEAISRLNSQQEQAAAAGRLFGRDVGTRLAPLIAGGAAEVDKLEARLRSVGGVMSNELAAAGDKVNSSFEQLTSVFKTAFDTAIVKSFSDEFKSFDDQLSATGQAAATLGSVFGSVFTLIIQGAANSTNAISGLFSNAGAAYDEFRKRVKPGDFSVDQLDTSTLQTNIRNLRSQAADLNDKSNSEAFQSPIDYVFGKSENRIAYENARFEENKKQADILLKKADELQKVIDERVKAASPKRADTPLPQYGPSMDDFLKAQQKDKEALNKQGEEVFNATRTAQEKYAAGTEKLNKLLETGTISQDTYNRATAQLKDSLLPVQSSLESTNTSLQQYQVLQERGAQITAGVATEQERYTASMSELDTLLQKNIISQETYSRATKSLTDNLSENVQARAEAKKQQEDQARAEKSATDSLKARADTVTQQTRTDEERYAQEKKNIDELLEAKLISDDTYQRKLAQIGEQFKENSGVAKAFSDTLEQAFDSLIAQSTSFEDGLKRIGLQLAANLAKQVLVPAAKEGADSLYKSLFSAGASAAGSAIGGSVSGESASTGSNYTVGGAGKTVSSPIGPVTKTTSGNYTYGGGLAEGGVASPGKAYLVGENGPEMFYPKVQGQVAPSSQNVVININAKDAQSVIQSRNQISSQITYALRQGSKNL